MYKQGFAYTCLRNCLYAASPCSAPASWARRSPRTWSMPTSTPSCSTCPRRKATRTASSTKAIANLGKLAPAPLAEQGAGRARSPPANYETGPGAAARLRPGHRGDRRAHGLEEGPVREDRAVRRRRTRSSPATPRAWASTSSPKCCPKQLRHRFCGVHFFNPPRYMHLVELIPAQDHRRRGARRPRDLPDHHARQGRGLRQGHAELHRQPHRRVLDAGRRCTTPQQFGLGFDVVDALTGPAIGRPKSATYRTADVVGLDTMAHVIKTMADTLPDDPWHAVLQGARRGCGADREGRARARRPAPASSRKGGKDILVLDLAAQDYRAVGRRSRRRKSSRSSRTRTRRRSSPQLRASEHPQAQFLWAIFRDLFHYSAYHLADIADNARDVDLAIRWGYGWSLGPFETWQAAGWKQVAELDRRGHRRRQGDERARRCRTGCSTAATACTAPRAATARRATPSVPRSAMPGLRAPALPGSAARRDVRAGRHRVRERRRAHVGTTATASPSSASRPRCTRSATTCSTACSKRSTTPSATSRGLVIWQPKEPFSAGADLAGALGLLQAGDVDEFEAMVANFQATSQRIKYSLVPMVAAVRGLALGGGCEFQMHCGAHRRCARELHRPGRSRRRPAAGRRRPEGIRGARARSGRAGRRRVRRSSRPRSRPSRWRKVSAAALEAKELELAARHRRGRVQRLELLHVAQAAGARAGRVRLPPAAARAPHPGRRRRRHRHLQDDAGQHARGPLHLASTTTRSPRASPPCCAAARSSAARWSTRSGCSSSSASTSSRWRRCRRRRSASSTCSRPASRCGTERRRHRTRT